MRRPRVLKPCRIYYNIRRVPPQVVDNMALTLRVKPLNLRWKKILEHYVHDSFEHFSMTGGTGTVMTDMSITDCYKVRKILPPTA